MNETLKDGTIDLLLDGIKKKIDSVRENFKWKRLFVDTGDFFINNPDMLMKFENELYSVFSEDNLYRLAQKLKNKRGYEFPQLLYKELHDLMIGNEIPEREAETYSYHFVQVIINYLEDNDQEKTMEIFLGEMRSENERNFTELKLTLEAVVEKINALGNEEVKVYSIADIDVEIKKKSKYKRMGLDFFELDDEQFESKFQNVIENDLIYVVGKSREETTFRILNELRSKKLESKTLIIKSEEEWDKLQKTSITGNILIPFFYTDQIAAITNNTNILVYGEDEPCYTRDKLVLRKRTKRNIINSLENIGIDTQEAYNVVDNTHGLYVPLKKKIFNEANHVNPAWVKSHSSVIMAALLCGKWTDSEGDKLIFEELAGKTYSECKSELENYLHIENPYVVINSSYTRTENMQLASVEDAWEELDIYITKDLWDKFVELFFEVLIVSEPIFKYPFEKHFEASVYAEKPDWSPILKKGMIRTLIMRAYYRNHEENQKQIDDVVQKVLDKITSKEGWGYISQYLTDLCEASPKSVLKRLEDELQNPQGMLEMFAATDGDIVTDVYLFAKVLWMTLKEDVIGFRGQYQRGDAQICLNKEKYENVVTLEPIHKLMEEATFDEMRKRISIAKCIEYLELQCKIMIEPESISKEKIDQLQYEEYSKRVVANNEPDEVSYTDKSIISDMLKGIISLADFYIESIETNWREQIQITDIAAGKEDSCKLLLYIDGNKIKEYLLNIKVMRYSKSNGKIILELGNDLKVTESYIPYAGSRRGFGNIYSQIYTYPQMKE